MTPDELNAHIHKYCSLRGRGSLKCDITVRLPPQMWDHLNDHARDLQSNQSAVLRLALYEYLERHGRNALIPPVYA